MQYLDFENKILEIDARIEEVQMTKASDSAALAKELERLVEKKQKNFYKNRHLFIFVL